MANVDYSGVIICIIVFQYAAGRLEGMFRIFRQGWAPPVLMLVVNSQEAMISVINIYFAEANNQTHLLLRNCLRGCYYQEKLKYMKEINTCCIHNIRLFVEIET